jgi:hypothetical protein
MRTHARLALISLTTALACNAGEPTDASSSATSATTGDTSGPGNPSTSPTTSATTTGAATDDPTGPTPTTTGATTTVDPGTTDGGTDTGEPGLACPLADVADAEQRIFTPSLFLAGDDPSDQPVCTIVNPERGFFQFANLRELDADTLEDAAAAGMSLIYGQVLIPEYRDAPLDAVVLDEVAAGLDLLRTHGMKVVPRFHYSNDGDEPDAELTRILGHIDQLAPLLQEHADVILTLQAGFIGAWGEWHSSQNGLDEPGPRKQILEALLAALPANRTVSVRRPSFKKDAFAGPLTAGTAHDGSALARVGHINDCFLASDSDFGTYQEDGEKDYAIADSAFVPVGGETCAVNPPRSECPAALDELALLHWTHLNAGYHPEVLQGWQDDGCYAEIACRLGYRLAVTELRWAASATPGQTLPVSITLVNDGYAAPVNPRPFVLMFDGPTPLEVVIVEFDVRTLLAGETRTLCFDVPLPDFLVAGSYRIGLRLSDAETTLVKDPRQAIRLANDADVEWANGINWFTAEFVVR